MLQGTFDTFSLTELIAMLASGNKTGTLEVQAGAAGGRIHFREGLCSGVEPGADLTSDEDVARLAAHVEATGGLTSLVNNAGGALGLDPVAEADVDGWRRMYEVNVLGTLRVTKALLPLLKASGRGDVLVVTSTAAIAPYEGGAGYTGAKHAERMLTTTLRLELIGEPVRVIDIAPGAVATEEFSLVRFGGDAERAAKVYEGYQPLLAEDIADVIAFALTRPHHVNIDTLVVRPRAQVSNTQTARS